MVQNTIYVGSDLALRVAIIDIHNMDFIRVTICFHNNNILSNLVASPHYTELTVFSGCAKCLSIYGQQPFNDPALEGEGDPLLRSTNSPHKKELITTLTPKSFERTTTFYIRKSHYPNNHDALYPQATTTTLRCLSLLVMALCFVVLGTPAHRPAQKTITAIPPTNVSENGISVRCILYYWPI